MKVKEIEWIKNNYFTIKTTDNTDTDYFKRVRFIKKFLDNINLEDRNDQRILVIIYQICFHHLAYSDLKINKVYYLNIKDSFRINNDFYINKYVDDVLVKVLTKQNIKMDSRYIENLLKDSYMVRCVTADNISTIIKDRIDNFELNIDVNETGKIISYADGIAEVYGIKNIIAGELVEFENNEKGLVSSINESSSSVVILGKGNNIKKGMLCNKSNEQILPHDMNNNIFNKEYKKMKKLNGLAIASTAALAGDYLSDIMLGINKKTASDIRCKEKKVAKRRAKNKNKKKGR